jgi:UDP-N-acetylmuramate: L-alanyl-gamma-D-glutamyl-meso-diaminopimelate ligase
MKKKTQHIHILGACGTFMGGLAILARRAGHQVSGSDQHTYPPMSTLLESEGIELHEGYDAEQFAARPDLVIIGNALSRGNPAVEYVLDNGLEFTSGPRWLGENYLRGKTVIAVTGTHGKTTTSSMVAWILESAGMSPGFEYDTAFFDKRAKFVHYRPQIVVLNNLEYDHADIYDDLAAIKTQFHHLIRTIPGKGVIISNSADANLESVLERGCWSRLERFQLEDEADWAVTLLRPDGSELTFSRAGETIGTLKWQHSGRHNAMNACAAVAAAAAIGVAPEDGLRALASFSGVKRRLELIYDENDIKVYDDFAHHPTAIRLTLEGLRRKHSSARLLVALEPRSNTMKAGVHINELGPALAPADRVWLFASEGINWDPHEALAPLEGRGRVVTKVTEMLSQLLEHVKPGDRVVFMSNGGFASAPRRFCEGLVQNGPKAAS